nr:hypothetical protein [Leptospira interrogans]
MKLNLTRSVATQCLVSTITRSNVSKHLSKLNVSPLWSLWKNSGSSILNLS